MKNSTLSRFEIPKVSPAPRYERGEAPLDAQALVEPAILAHGDVDHSDTATKQSAALAKNLAHSDGDHSDLSDPEHVPSFDILVPRRF
jgi:hypothetical protein